MPTETSRFGVSGPAGLSPDSFAAPSADQRISWPDPTPDMLNDPVFNAIWHIIKGWDVSVPGAYSGRSGATGNHARAIYDAVRATAPRPSVRDDGGPAFPGPDGGASVVNHPFGFGQAVPTMQMGMSLRDWLAGQAVSGAMVDRSPESFFNPHRCAELARAAYGVADAMLAARKGGAL